MCKIINNTTTELTNLTVVTTLDFLNGDKKLLERALYFIKSAQKIGVNVVIGLAARNNKVQLTFEKLASNYTCCLIEKVQCMGIVINNSLLRNVALSKVSTAFLIYLDIDIFLDKDLLIDMVKSTEKEQFSAVPCLYLSESESKLFQKQANPKAGTVINKYLNGDKACYRNLALPSSVIMLTKDLAQRIGPWDILFNGHGFEDFDYEIKLFKELNLLTFDEESKVYNPTQACALMRGFRADLALFYTKNLFSKKWAIHLFHEVRNRANYSKMRQQNHTYFNNKHFKNENDNLLRQTLDSFFSVPKILSVMEKQAQVQANLFEDFKVLFI